MKVPLLPTCREMAELVTDYLEKALPLRVRLAARLHLALCSACSRYYDQMRRTAAFLRSRPPRPPAEAAEHQILQRLWKPPK
jgi:predicted anti-sigma-YlaC factor YlaD